MCNFKGQHGIEEEVFLSVPCVVGEFGITHIFNQKLDPEEAKQILASAKSLRKILDEVKIWICGSWYESVDHGMPG